MGEFCTGHLSQVRAIAGRIRACDGGNVAMTFGFALPVLIGLAGLGVDSASFYNQQTRMQSVADASLGTIYLPRGNFSGDGKDLIQATTNILGGVTGALGVGGLLPIINEAAAYTVIVANKLDLKGVNLVINADYASSDVPVPAGVGPNSSAVRLTN